MEGTPILLLQSLFGGDDHGRHGAKAVWNAIVSTEGVDLFAFEFCAFLVSGGDDGLFLGVDGLGELHSLVVGVAKEGFEHLDDIFV